MSEEVLRKIREICTKDPRYKIDAYVFVFQALDHTVEHIAKVRRHVSGQELLEGIRQLAIKLFGPLAKVRFELWGVRKTEDWGEIVWNLVQSGLMGKTEQDTKEDFRGGYAFDDAFSVDKTLDLSSSEHENP